MALEVNNWINICAQTNTGCIGVDHFSKGEQYQKTSFERIVGAGAKSRSGDNLVVMTECRARKIVPLGTISAKEEGEFYLVESTLRDFNPTPPVIVEWTWPIYRVRADLEFAAYKSKRASARVDGDDDDDDEEDGRGKPKYEDELYLKPLRNLPAGLTGPEWLKAVWKITGKPGDPVTLEGGEPSKASFYNKVKVFKGDGKVRENGRRYSLV
jgi:hypothetical protein